jgi:hypothetical protein
MKQMLLAATGLALVMLNPVPGHAALSQKACDEFGKAYFTLNDAVLDLGDAQMHNRIDASGDKQVTLASYKVELGEYAAIFKLLQTLSANDCKVLEPQSRVTFNKAWWDSLYDRWHLPFQMTVDAVKAVEPNAPELNVGLY